MIRDKIRQLTLNLMAWLFRPVKVPNDLSGIKAELSRTILVTQSASKVIEGLLLSLARQSGFAGINKLSRTDLEALIKNPAQDLAPFSWASIHDFPVSNRAITVPSIPCLLKIRTFNVFQVTGPIRKWPSFRPSVFWLWGLILTRRILKITIGEAIDLRQNSAQRLIRLIKIDFIRTLKLVRGTPIEPREEQAATILSGAEFEREIKVLSDRNNISVEEGRKLAEKSFYELSANPRRFMYDALGFVAKLILNRLFSEIHSRGLDHLIPAIKEQTVVLVPMHRSHLDYVIVTYKLFSERVNPPFVAAGINLSFWPFGFIFRSVGAYFVKRNAKDRFHAIVLKRYLSYLVNRGHLQEFFIEGGRSRSGKMMEPKLGLLSTIIEAARSNSGRDILFVPVAITYENIVEDEAYGKENSGGSKVKESIVSTLKAFDIFKRRYGEAIIEFGSPVSLKDFRNEFTSKELSSSSNKALAQSLGYEICRNIRNQTNPGLTSLAYSAILMSAHYGLKLKDLRSKILQLHNALTLLKSCGQQIGTYTSHLESFIAEQDHILSELTAAKILHLQNHHGIPYFYIPGSIRFTADYYRNTILHYFFPVSALALCQLTHKKISSEGVKNIFDFCAQDLLLPEWHDYSAVLDKLCSALTEKNILEKLANNEYIFKDSSFFLPTMLAGQMQSCLWVTRSLLYPQNLESAASGELTLGKFISALIQGAKAEIYVGGVSRTEATSRSSIMSALVSLESRDIIKFSEGSGSNRKISLATDGICQLRKDLDLLSRINHSLNLYLLEEEFRLGCDCAKNSASPL